MFFCMYIFIDISYLPIFYVSEKISSNFLESIIYLQVKLLYSIAEWVELITLYCENNRCALRGAELFNEQQTTGSPKYGSELVS